MQKLEFSSPDLTNFVAKKFSASLSKIWSINQEERSYVNQKDLVRQFLKKRKCESVARAYKVVIPSIIEFLIVFRAEPKISGNINSVVALQTAVVMGQTPNALPTKIDFKF